jgi:hypothetical protein
MYKNNAIMDQFDQAILEIIRTYNDGMGVGIPTIDRMLMQRFEISDLQKAGLFGGLSTRLFELSEKK